MSSLPNLVYDKFDRLIELLEQISEKLDKPAVQITTSPVDNQVEAIREAQRKAVRYARW